jgi:hypothetical protein
VPSPPNRGQKDSIRIALLKASGSFLGQFFRLSMITKRQKQGNNILAKTNFALDKRKSSRLRFLTNFLELLF